MLDLIVVMSNNVPYLDVVNEALRASGKLRVRSALNPVLWLCGVTQSLGFCSILVGFIIYQDSFPHVLFWIIVMAFIFVPLFLISFGFVYILLKLPDMLQSEDFQLRKQELMSQEKGMGKEIQVDGNMIEDLNEDKKEEE